jgi:hypothetical protein
MPAVTVTTVSTSVQTSTPTFKELVEFNHGECPICWLPTIGIATEEQPSDEEQLNGEEQLNVVAAKQTDTTFMTGNQSSGATASQPEAVPNIEAKPEATPTTGLQSSDATADQPETTAVPASIKTPCKHIFHVDCLETWINDWRETAPTPFIPALPTCPYCRTELPVIIEKNLIYHDGKKFEEILELIKKWGVRDVELFGENTACYCLESEEAMGLMDKVYIAEVEEEGEEKQEEVEQVEHEQEEMKDEARKYQEHFI